MGITVRRWLAFAGGCMAGLGLGGLASAVVSAANWYINYPSVTSATAAPTSTMWVACLAIGAGLGIAVAAAIRE